MPAKGKRAKKAAARPKAPAKGKRASEVLHSHPKISFSRSHPFDTFFIPGQLFFVHFWCFCWQFLMYEVAAARPAKKPRVESPLPVLPDHAAPARKVGGGSQGKKDSQRAKVLVTVPNVRNLRQSTCKNLQVCSLSNPGWHFWLSFGVKNLQSFCQKFGVPKNRSPKITCQKHQNNAGFK